MSDLSQDGSPKILSRIPSLPVQPKSLDAASQLLGIANVVALGWAAFTGFTAMALPVLGVVVGYSALKRVVRFADEKIMGKAPKNDLETQYFTPRRRLFTNIVKQFPYNRFEHLKLSSGIDLAGATPEEVHISSRLNDKLTDGEFVALIGHEAGHYMHGHASLYNKRIADQRKAAGSAPALGCVVATAFIAVGAPLAATAAVVVIDGLAGLGLLYAISQQQRKIEHVCDEAGAAAAGSAFQMISSLRKIEQTSNEKKQSYSPLQKVWYALNRENLPGTTVHPSFKKRRQHLHKLRSRFNRHQAQMAEYRDAEERYQNFAAQLK